MSNVDNLVPIGPLNRTGGVLNAGAQASDHNIFQRQLDSLLSATQLDIDGLLSLLSVLSQSGEPGVNANIPVPSTAYYPLNSLSRVLSSPRANPTMVTIGSSLSQGDDDDPGTTTASVVGGSRIATLSGGWAGTLVQPGNLVLGAGTVIPVDTYVESISGTSLVMSQAANTTSNTGLIFVLDSWAQRLGRSLARTMGRPIPVGYGFRGLWISSDSSSDDEWGLVDNSAGGGAWQPILTSSAADVAPWGSGYIGTSVTTGINVMAQWNGGSNPLFTLPVLSFEIVWNDIAGGNNWSYSYDQTTWHSMGQTRNGNNKLRKFFVNAPLSSPQQVWIAPSSQVGGALENGAGFAGATVAPVGIIPYTVAGVSATGTDTTNTPPALTNYGWMVHDLGQDGHGITFAGAGTFGATPFANPASGGDPLAILDLLQPDLVMLETDYWDMQCDPVALPSSATAIKAGWSTILTRIAGYADLIAWNPAESGTYTHMAYWRAAFKTWAAANGIVLFDVYDALTASGFGYPNAPAGVQESALDAAGWTDSLGVHPAQYGQTDLATRFARLIRTTA